MRDDVHSSLPPGGPDAADVPDAELARRIACGDRRSLAPLYRRHKGLVYRFALLWTGSAATAADITQDVFMHLLTRACDFDPVATLTCKGAKTDACLTPQQTAALKKAFAGPKDLVEDAHEGVEPTAGICPLQIEDLLPDGVDDGFHAAGGGASRGCSERGS